MGDQEFDFFEVNRQGDSVFLIISSVEEDQDTDVYEFTPEDATKVGLALFHAGQPIAEETMDV